MGYRGTRGYDQRRDLVRLTRFRCLLDATIVTVSDDDDVIAIDISPVVASASSTDVILERILKFDGFLWFGGS